MSFTIKVVQDIEDAKKWWNKFSPQIFIHDTWEFRFCYYKYFNYPVFFYVGFVDKEPVGLLPLQLNNEKNHLEFFGGAPMSNNRVFIFPGYEKFIRNFYENINRQVDLIHLSAQDTFITTLPVTEEKYILDLLEFNDFNNYLQKSFSSKSRNSLLKKNREIEQRAIRTESGKKEDLVNLFEFNIKRFGAESSFLFPHRKDIYYDFFDLPFKKDFLLFTQDGVVEGASFGLIYKENYLFVNSGFNNEVSNLGNYIYCKSIESAFGLGCRYFDAGMGSYGWKERLHLKAFPQYCLKNYE